MKKIFTLVLLGVFLVGCASANKKSESISTTETPKQENIEITKPIPSEQLKREESWNVDANGFLLSDIKWSGKEEDYLKEAKKYNLEENFNLTGEYFGRKFSGDFDDLIVDENLILQIKDDMLYIFKNGEKLDEAKIISKKMQPMHDGFEILRFDVQKSDKLEIVGGEVSVGLRLNHPEHVDIVVLIEFNKDIQLSESVDDSVEIQPGKYVGFFLNIKK